MKRMTLLSALLLLVVAVAACAPAPTVETTSTALVPVTGETDTPVVAETATSAETATTEATEAPTTAATEATGGTTDMTISTSSSADVSEPFLVDNQGRVLYVFTNDTQNSGSSACTGDCLASWPPVIVTGPVNAGEGVDAAMLGTIARDDGTMQATYNGWPLYYYSGDAAPGDMMGQGMNDSWYLVSGTGTAIQQ